LQDVRTEYLASGPLVGNCREVNAVIMFFCLGSRALSTLLQTVGWERPFQKVHSCSRPTAPGRQAVDTVDSCASLTCTIAVIATSGRLLNLATLPRQSVLQIAVTQGQESGHRYLGGDTPSVTRVQLQAN